MNHSYFKNSILYLILFFISTTLHAQTITSFSNQQAGNPADDLIDGNFNPDARWSAQGFPQSVVIDYGSTRSITATRLWTYQNRAYQYTIEASNNPNSGFVQIVNRSNNSTAGSPITNTFAAKQGRYIRITVTGASGYGGDWVSLREFQITSQAISNTNQPNLIQLDVNSATNATQNGFTAITGNPGATASSQGVSFELFGFPANIAQDRGTGGNLLRDFAMHNGTQNGTIGLRINNLPSGTYQIKSYHYESNSNWNLGSIEVEFRKTGQTSGTILATDVNSASSAPVTYQITSDGVSSYELIFRDDHNLYNRSRFNGIVFENPNSPPPSSSAPALVQLDVNSATNATQNGFTAITGNPGATASSQGVSFELFGFPTNIAQDRGTGGNLLRDFAMHNGTQNGIIGLRINNLPSGTYQIRSYHYESNSNWNLGSIEVEFKKIGQSSGTILATDVNIASSAPATYQITSDGVSSYELIFRDDHNLYNRSRFNGIVFENPNGNPVQNNDIKEISPDGAYATFTNAKAVLHNGHFYVGHAISNGQIGITRYNPNTETSSLAIISTAQSQQQDYRVSPSITVLSDGRLLTMYGKYHLNPTANGGPYYYRISNNTNPITINDWGPEIARPFNGNSTYSSTWMLSGENNRIYNIHRAANHTQSISTSNNQGQTWNEPIPLFSSRSFTKAWSDNSNRIDICYNNINKRYSVYHMYYENNTFRRTNGSFLKNLSNMPLSGTEDGSLVYEVRSDAWGPGQGPDDWIPGRAWVADTKYQANGNPIVTFQVQQVFGGGNGIENHRLYYYYVTWNGSSWEKHFIAHAGGPVFNQFSGSHSGGIAIDPENPNIVYISTNANNPFDLSPASTQYSVPLNQSGMHEIWKGVTNDGGATFQWTPITSNSTEPNYRPYVTNNHGYDEHVLWFSGDFNYNDDYQTKIKGVFNNGNGNNNNSTNCRVKLSSVPIQYIVGQGFGTGTINEGNYGITINSNGWNVLNIPHTIDSGTKLEFEFKSTAQGETHSIGFTNQLSAGSLYGKRFKLYGTQNVSTAEANQNYSYDGSGNWQSFSIPIGNFFTGSFDNIVFINDNDANPSGSNSSFKNVRLVDANGNCLTSASFRSYAVSELMASPSLGQKTNLEWYHQPREGKEVATYTFQHFDFSLEKFDDIEVVTPSMSNSNLFTSRYLHQNSVVGENLYQVKIEYSDGTVEYSDYKVVVFGEQVAPITIVPNPAQNQLHLDLTNYRDKSIQYSISSLQGKMLISNEFDANHMDTETINLESIQNGIYIIYLKPENHKAIAQKFIIQKDY